MKCNCQPYQSCPTCEADPEKRSTPGGYEIRKLEPLDIPDFAQEAQPSPQAPEAPQESVQGPSEADSVALWNHEEDTYSDLGHEVIDRIKRAVHSVIDSYMDAGCDAQHMAALANEAANTACFEAWNARNGYEH